MYVETNNKTYPNAKCQTSLGDKVSCEWLTVLEMQKDAGEKKTIMSVFLATLLSLVVKLEL